MAEKTTAAPRPAPLPAELDAGAEDSTIRPFTVEIPEADLRELQLLSEDVRATFRSLR